MGILAATLQTISAVILLIPDVSHAAIMFAFYNAGTSYIVNPLLFGWANVICQRGGDDALRSVILYSMNASSSILYTFWGIVFYPATDAPYWKKGAIVMICIAAVMTALLWVVLWVRLFHAPSLEDNYPNELDSSIDTRCERSKSTSQAFLVRRHPSNQGNMTLKIRKRSWSRVTTLRTVALSQAVKNNWQVSFQREETRLVFC